MIDKSIHLMRVVALSLAVVFALAAPQLAIAQTAVVGAVASEMPNAFARDAQSEIVLAQQAPKKAKPDVLAGDSSEERAKVRGFIDEKTKWIKEQPLIQTFLAVLPALWTPFKVASLLLFLIAYVFFHFRRQRRNQAEAELRRQPSAHEAEFGITAEARREV